MPKTPPPALSLAFADLRTRTGLNQEEAAAELEIGKSTLSGWETGSRTLKRDVADDALLKLDQETEALDVLLTAHELVDAIDGRRLADVPGSPLALTPEERRSFARSAMSGAALAGRAIYDELARQRREEIRAEERRKAEEVWGRLKSYSWPERFLLVEGSVREARTFALAELLSQKSLKAGTQAPHTAVHLAELACRVAELMVGDPRSVAHTQACTWAHLANARRVASDLPASERTFVRTWEFWRAGEGSELDLLPEWRLLDFEASLRRDQREFTAAEELHARALAVCGDGAVTGRLLLNRASTLIEKGEHEEALEVLEEARPAIEEAGDRRLLCVYRFNVVVNLDGLGRHEEVSRLLPGVRGLALDLRQKIDLIRLDWLDGRALASEGRLPEALGAFERARRGFTEEALPYDTALVSVAESILLLASGKSGKVQVLAEEMQWIFKAQGVHPEALKALRLFCEAVRQEEATVDLARRVFEFLRAARHDPKLCFAD